MPPSWLMDTNSMRGWGFTASRGSLHNAPQAIIKVPPSTALGRVCFRTMRSISGFDTGPDFKTPLHSGVWKYPLLSLTTSDLDRAMFGK
jgi:hypothetical protein